MSEKGRLSGGEIVGWMLAGFGVGLLAGAAVATLVGRGAPTRVRRAIGSWRGAASSAPTIASGARAVRTAFEQSDLRHFSIEVVPVKAGVVELHGWVPTRAIRSRAFRLASQVTGIERVINGLLVQGEDDKGLKVSNLTDQTA